MRFELVRPPLRGLGEPGKQAQVDVPGRHAQFWTHRHRSHRSSRSEGSAERSVYDLRMSRINVYLPDELADRARAAGLNVSSLTQQAVQRELQARSSNDWVGRVEALPAVDVTHDDALVALDAARDEFGAWHE